MLWEQEATASADSPHEVIAALPPHLTTEQILAHERFALARNHYMQVAVDSHSTDPAIKHLMHEVARVVLFNIILGRHALQRDDDPATWLTVGALREAFMPFGMASPRRFDQILARMRSIELITLAPAPHDRRLRLVVPTAKMFEEDLDWLAVHMSPLAVLRPDCRDYDPALNRDRRYQRAQRIASTRHYAHARKTLAIDERVMPFLMRQDAGKIVFIYLLAAAAGPDPLRVSLSFEAAARQLTTSRTHVRNLMLDMQAAGLLRLHGKGGRDIELTPALWRGIDLFLASAMSGHDFVWQSARRLIAAENRSTQ